ncbi:1970_t:CDS:1, partial [Racocetra persica]
FIDMFLIRLYNATKYCWELKDIYIHTKNSRQTGDITVYLRCSQRCDRIKKESNSKQIVRVSEIKPAIERYLCNGNIRLIILKHEKRIQLIIEHLVQHQYPIYQNIEVPLEAKNWIKNNITYSVSKIDFYRKLSELKLINPTKHTYHQIYYW